MRPRFDPTGEIEVQSDSMCLSAHSWLKRGVKNLPDCSSRRMPGAQSSFLTPNPCVKVSIDAHDAVHLFVSSVIRRHRVQLVLFGSKSWLCSDPCVCGHASVSGRHASGLCIKYSFPIDAPPVGPRLDEVSAHTPAPACTPRCFGYRNHTPESPALPMQSPAVSRSRHLTVCGGVSVCASAIVPDIRCFGYRNLTLETSSPSSQSSAVASPGPAKCCARSTSPLCHAVI